MSTNTTEDRMKMLEAYAEWIGDSDSAKLPPELDEAMLMAGFPFGQMEAAMSDIAQALRTEIASIRAEEAKVLHRETSQEVASLPKLYTLTTTPDELFVVSHLMCAGVLFANGSELSIKVLPHVRRGVAVLGAARFLELISRVNKLTIAAFPEAQIINLSKEQL